MDTQFMIFDKQGLDCHILDKKRNKIFKLSHGVFDDYTEKCEKQYLKEKDKPYHKNGKKLGGLWYEFLNGKCDRTSACIWKDDVVIETDNQEEFDKKLFEIQNEQLERMIKRCENNLKDLESERQYYTYEFSNH